MILRENLGGEGTVRGSAPYRGVWGHAPPGKIFSPPQMKPCHVEHLSHQRLFSKAGEVVAARSNINPRRWMILSLNKKNFLCYGIAH